ncbi:hypothetical protein JTB14_024910 [Gonioctena quinquepunctata]|nr:hypothetical protein JTB14_024910 [Gonioctena quinquepunctata]
MTTLSDKPRTFLMSTRNIPSEPCPLPSLGSDEESFVVLGNSLSPDTEITPSEELFEPIGSNVIEEAKQLIDNELSAMEKLSLSQKTLLEDSVKENVTTDGISSDETVKEQDASFSPKIKSLDESSITLPEMPHVERELQETSNMISIATLSNDLSSEEVQSQISLIIEENIHLKDVLIQNNMSMKSQIERIVAWQEDVQKVHQAHKDKLIEAKEFIERLKKDNISKSHELEKMKEIIKSKENETATLKIDLQNKEFICHEKLAQSTDNNIKEFELDIANKKVMELEIALKELTLKNANLKEKNSNLTKENLNLIGDKSKLVNSIEQNKICKTQLEDLEAAQKKIEELKIAVSTIQTVAAKKEAFQTDLINDLQSRLPQAEELVIARTQLAEIQIKLTQTEHSRAAAYAQVAAMTRQIVQLKEQIKDMDMQLVELNKCNEELLAQSASKDEMFALQTQLEVYKADFEAEKNAKEITRGEKDKLVEDLQNLQRRNQQLQEEIELVRNNRDYVVYPSTRREQPSRSTASAPQESSPPFRRYACPICSLQFRSLRLLEDHVDMCIGHRT